MPLRKDEEARLEKEEAEQKELVPGMERVLVAVDNSANGSLAAHLAGLFSAGRRTLTTVLDVTVKPGVKVGQESPVARQIKDVVASALEISARAAADGEAATVDIDDLIQAKMADSADALAREAGKGYSIAFVGLGRPITAPTHRFAAEVEELLAAFDRPIGIALNGHAWSPSWQGGRILVPTGGTAPARLATEVAFVLAKTSGGRVTALHVFDPQEDIDMLRGRLRRGLGVSVLRDVRRLGKRSGVPVEVLTAAHTRPELAIQRVAASAKFDLVVLGAALRIGEKKFLGPRSAALVQAIKAPLLLVAQ